MAKSLEDHHRDAKYGVNGKKRHVSYYNLDRNTLKGKGHYLVNDHQTAIPVPDYPGLLAHNTTGLATYLFHKLKLSNNEVNRVLDRFRKEAEKQGLDVDAIF